MKKYMGKIVGVLFALLAMGMTVCAAATDDINIKKNQVFQVNSEAGLHEQPDAASAVTATLPGGTPVIIKEDAKDGWCKVAYQEQTGYVQVSILGLLGSPVSPAVPVSTDQEEQGATENQTVPPEETNTNGETVPNDSAVSDDETAVSGETRMPDEDSVDEGVVIKSEPGEDDETTPVQDVNALDEEFRNIQEENILSYQEAEAAEKQAASEKIWGIVIAVLVIAIFAVGIITTLVGNKGKKRQE